MPGVVEKVLLGDGDDGDPGLRDLIAAVQQIADALDRGIALAEDWSNALGLPETDGRG